ncbi:MAG: 30S ribosomal protein S17 [Nanoarchaeota archaeon]
MTTKKQQKNSKECNDCRCPFHGNLKTRGRTFQGKVINKKPKRITIEFERDVYVKKYERYAKSKTKIHSRLPECMENIIQIGDYVKVRECRPLSKIIHSVVIEKIKDTKNKIKLNKEKK